VSQNYEYLPVGVHGKNIPTDDRMLIVLQFWEGDKAAAMKNARLVADLVPRREDKVDFLFSARFDCTHDKATVEYVSRKFNTRTFINSNRRLSGWPGGCNELFFGSVDFIYSLIQSGKMPPYKAILFFEADGYPLTPSWLRELSSQWDRFYARGARIIGHRIPPGPPESGGLHINGNCLISGDFEFLHWLSRKLGGCTAQGGWDYVLAPLFKQRGWADCPAMKSYWHAPTMERAFFDKILADGVVFSHGVKDDSVIRLVRERYLLGS
jgi:hypothetical protein